MDARLPKVIENLISPNKYAFIKWDMLFDKMVVVNEIVDLAKRSKKGCHIFKVGIEKAYESVS